MASMAKSEMAAGDCVVWPGVDHLRHASGAARVPDSREFSEKAMTRNPQARVAADSLAFQSNPKQSQAIRNDQERSLRMSILKRADPADLAGWCSSRVDPTVVGGEDKEGKYVGCHVCGADANQTAADPIGPSPHATHHACAADEGDTASLVSDVGNHQQRHVPQRE